MIHRGILTFNLNGIVVDKTDTDVVKQEGNSGETQTDWSMVCELFNNPFVLAAYELPPTVYTLANSAVKEMRRYYSRKVVDVLIKITRQSIDTLRKKFSQESGKGQHIVNILNYYIIIYVKPKKQKNFQAKIRFLKFTRYL